MNRNSYIKMQKFGDSLAENSDNLPEIRVAVLGDFATQQLVKILKASLHKKGYFPRVYEADFNAIQTEIFSPDSHLYSFQPDYVYIAVSMQGFRSRFYNAATDEKKQLSERYCDELAELCQPLGDKGIQIILNTLSLPVERIFGNYSIKTPISLYNAVIKVNNLMAEKLGAIPGCHLNDVMSISSTIGLENWYDEKLWVHSKYLCSPVHFPRITESVAGIIAASRGKVTKCIVLDCDNTLWGGIIGDDGLEGIELGPEGVGEAFYRFQQFLMQLKERGYIITVCSKNEYENAILPFREHPNMVLKEDDITLFVANWNNKPSNIEYIAEVLNIGLDSMIFIDDSVFERNQVRELLPQIIVPEMPEDPAEYIRALDSEGIFETISTSEEDKDRTKMYKAQAARSIEAVKFRNVDDFLVSLQMQVTFNRFDKLNLPRAVQLMQRSNQFNLRTQRFSESQCVEFMKNTGSFYPVYVKLKDKYGDNGLIGVVCTEYKGDSLFISEFVMSCRVLKRGVEYFIMNRLVSHARSKKLLKIVGEHIPTKKNFIVKDFFAQYGFVPVHKDNDRVTWELNVDDYTDKKCFMERVND
ncbi:HAD-IIIC family phosphatase [candidate division KSB1 bacterium]